MQKLKCKVCSTIFYDETDGRWLQNCPECKSCHYFNLDTNKLFRNNDKKNDKVIIQQRMKCIDSLIDCVDDKKLVDLRVELEKLYRRL